MFKETIRKTLTSLVLALTLAVPLSRADAPTVAKKYLDNSYCLRVSAVVEDNRESKGIPLTCGTTFVIRSGFETFFATNRHVVESAVDIEKGVPQGTTLEKILYSIGDSFQDMNFNDDIKLELIGVSKDYDVAILRTRNLIRQDIPAIGKPKSVGLPLYSVGYPFGFTKVLEEGILSTLDIPSPLFKNAYWASLDTINGMSGAPVYMKQDDNYFLLGMIGGGTTTGIYSMVVPAKQIYDLLDETLKDRQAAKKNVAEILGDSYPYILK